MVYPATTYHDVVPIEDGALSRRHGPLRRLEFHHDAALLARHPTGPRRESVPHLNLAGYRLRYTGHRDPVHVAHRKSPAQQIGIVADDHAVLLRLDPHDILRPSRCAQSFALPDGVVVDPLMAADDL